MATQDTNASSTNTVRGKVTLKESGVGIPDLLVVIYDLDPGSRPEEPFDNPDGGAGQPQGYALQGDRLGSVITAKDGTWLLTYTESEFRISPPLNEKRPDLQLMVLAPEDADKDKPPVILFNSKVLRQNSGRNEGYLIRISAKQLIDAELPVPGTEKDPITSDNQIENLRSRKTAEKALRDGMRMVNKEFEDAERPLSQELRDSFKKAILPNRDLLNNMFNFVKETDTIGDVQKKVFIAGGDYIDSRTDKQDPTDPKPGKGMKINLMLTEDEKTELQSFKFSVDGTDYYSIPEEKIQEMLFKREADGGINTILFSNNPITKYCIEKSADEKCALIHAGLAQEENGEHHHPDEDDDGEEDDDTTPPSTPPLSEGITPLDVPHYLESILAEKDSTQFRTTSDYSSKRSNDRTVQHNVDSFALQRGPADTTAFYDFHSLQIAFDHVWQQLLDETLVNLSEKINAAQENTGRKGILQAIRDQTAFLPSSGLNFVLTASVEAERNTAQEVPSEISAAFDISLLEYDALSADNKLKLMQLAKDINKYEADSLRLNTTSFESGWLDFASTSTPKFDSATRAVVLRDQGERIIDNVRINKPFTTNQMLKELQERLLSKYEFTVFAADKNYHSINFGLMNTYRQKWEPISYQAGKLVKTIPLSPKEERKYAVKQVQTSKVTRKQAQKNNESLRQEINTTSRAESEIVAKAHDKSNFNMSVKLDYSKISSEVAFGKEASKDSSQAKKDFREAVIKAAQEFKEERALEINTEESETSEYSESGTITNPNDELSVTYLFYELQRRYRISEQLYRVMPVVLVAQEVPSPDQITEGWIVAHDWILNRALLDDSFRPTLQYLAKKNVGDDFAIRELRKNLRQQRTLVNNLQVEFSKMKTLVDNKYQYLQENVRNRIDEEHDKRFYKWWWWWGREDGRNEPPDPEMAKAMEQAAADDHKHAVEQAERLSLSVQREVHALHQLTAEYNAAMRDHLDQITQTRRLITHIKENILFYMQAIWSMEPPDQRFMRLYKVKIPHFEADRTCVIQDTPVEDFFAQFRKDNKQKHVAWISGKLKRTPDGSPDVSYKQLIEVADLDTLLGFKGNYMIFPLKEHNALTEFMAAPYIDQAFGAMDPDELSNISLDEFAKYICCLHDEDPDEYNRLKGVLIPWLEKLLADPLRNGDEVIVPTGSLFIEMLPSDKSLLEDFKLKHREWDVYKVQAEVRKLELENIRYAARLLHEEREDPEIEKKIIFDGSTLHTDVDADN